MRPGTSRRIRECVLVTLVAAVLISGCDRPDTTSARASARAARDRAAATQPNSAIRSSGDASLASFTITDTASKSALEALLTAARERRFAYLFENARCYAALVAEAKRVNPRDAWDEQIRALRSAQAERFAAGDCDPELLELLNLLRSPCDVEVRRIDEPAPIDHNAQRIERAVRCELMLKYRSAAQSPLVEGALLQRVLLEVLLDEPGGKFAGCARPKKGAVEWEQPSLAIYAAGTQIVGTDVVIEARLLGGRPPIQVSLRCGSLALWRRWRDEDRSGGIMRTAKFTVPQAAIQDWMAPAQWMLVAYDAASDVQAVNLSGTAWSPSELRPYSENRLWWVNDPWHAAGQFSRLPAIHESRERGLLFPLNAISSIEREKLVAHINEENELRTRQHASLKISHEPGRTVHQFTAYPRYWSMAIQLPPGTSRWELDTSGKRADVLLSNGQRYLYGQQSEIVVSPGTSMHFMAAEPDPFPVRLIIHHAAQ